MKRILSILFCLALPLCLSAQIRNNRATRKTESDSNTKTLETKAAKSSDNNSSTSQSTIYDLTSHDDADHDLGVSALGKKIVMSELSDDYVVETTVPFDTTFYLPHRFRRADEYSQFNAGLGNYGLPFYQINFMDRVSDPDKFLYRYYYPLMHLPENTQFMDTQIPFTEMKWSYSGPRDKSEQTFRVKHSQNVNKRLNFGLIYDIIYDIGQYKYQKADEKTASLFSSYKGNIYNFYLSVGINNISNRENGGMESSDLSTLEGVETEDVPVNLSSLNNASTALKNRNLLFVQKLNIDGSGKSVSDSTSSKKPFLSGTLSHILEMDGNRRTYSDNSPTSGFYDTTYISTSVTFDSLMYRNIKNTLRFDFLANENGKFRLGGGVAIRHELHRYGQITPTLDSLLSDTLSWKHNNLVLAGKLYNNIGDKFKWEANGELFFSGYRSGDFTLDGKISKIFSLKKGDADLSIVGGMRNIQPSFWFSKWGGNNFIWNRDLSKEFRTNVGISFKYPERTIFLEANYVLIDNFTYFGEDALPIQHEDPLSVLSVSAKKNLRLWKIHLDTEALLQISSDKNILDLPLLAVQSAFYFQHLFRFKRTNGKLEMQLGADVRYHTEYYPYAYMPAIGQYYNQHNIKAGNYPYVDVFANFLLKRARIFISYDHVNQGFTGNNYFEIPSYPMNIRMFRYGIAWTFYN